MPVRSKQRRRLLDEQQGSWWCPQSLRPPILWSTMYFNVQRYNGVQRPWQLHENGCECVASVTEGYFQGGFCNDCLTGYSKPSSTCSRGSSCVNGQCDANNNCACYDNATLGYWEGLNCTLCLHSSPLDGHWSGPRCLQCHPGYRGTCATACPPPSTNATAEARVFAKVACANATTMGRCTQCLEGFYGAECVLCNAVETCSGNGKCNAAGKCVSNQNKL